MTRVMVGDALVFENDRLLARMNQFFDRIESQLRQSLRAAAEAAGSATPTVDANAQASVLTALRGRPPAALRPLGLQAQPDRAPRRRAEPARRLTTPAAQTWSRSRWPAGRIELLPQKAAFLPDTRTLLIADAHIGKATSFRALGVPVPRGTTSETLSLLGELVARHGARRIVFLGDFLHSARSHVAATLDARGALARAASDARNRARARQPRRSRRRSAGVPRLHGGRRTADGRAASRCATTPSRWRAPTCSPATCTPASSVQRPRTRAPAPAVLPLRRAGRRAAGLRQLHRHAPGRRPVPGDRVFAVADDAVRELPT